MIEDLSALIDGDDSATDPSQDPEQIDGKEPVVDETTQEFNKLTGSSQDRFRKVISRAKAAEAENERLKALAYGNTKLPPPPPSNPDIKNAIEQLDTAGIATKDYVKQQMDNYYGQMAYDNRLKALSEQENGEDGRQKFDRMEYEDFVRQNPQYRTYDPGDVFGIMYRDELMDYEIKNRDTKPNLSQPLKNGKTSGRDEIWTPEYIEQQIREKGQKWYEKNFDKINTVLAAST